MSQDDSSLDAWASDEEVPRDVCGTSKSLTVLTGNNNAHNQHSARGQLPSSTTSTHVTYESGGCSTSSSAQISKGPCPNRNRLTRQRHTCSTGSKDYLHQAPKQSVASSPATSRDAHASAVSKNSQMPRAPKHMEVDAEVRMLLDKAPNKTIATQMKQSQAKNKQQTVAVRPMNRTRPCNKHRSMLPVSANTDAGTAATSSTNQLPDTCGDLNVVSSNTRLTLMQLLQLEVATGG